MVIGFILESGNIFYSRVKGFKALANQERTSSVSDAVVLKIVFGS